jgi:large conductance mechanosensitive channel
MLKEFKAFIARGNVLDLAVAVIMGAAFGRVVSTLVDGIILPPIGLLTGGVDFASLFYVLDSSKGIPPSLEAARAAGIPVIAYGQLITDLITFLVVALVMFLIVRQYNALSEPAAAPPATKECPLCLSAIPLQARRCAHCTADLA